RFEHRVGESEIEQIFDGFFPQEVVDPKDRFLGKDRCRNPVEGARRFKVVAERLFDDDAATRAKAGSAQPFDDRGEQWRRYGEVVSRVLRAVESFFEELERGVAVVVAINVAKQRKQAIECLA